MLSINTNLSSLIAQNSMKTSTNKLNQAIERMSTGYKINHSKDNAANYSISTNMDTKIGSLQVAEDNASMGLDLITTATGNLELIQDKLTRLRDLQEQASNGTYGGQSLKAINSEVNALVDEINRLYDMAEYNGLKLFGTSETQQAEPTQASEPIATFALTRTTSFDGLERVSEADSIDANKSYRIDDYTDLKTLQDFVNGGGDTTNVTFELTSDINMQGEAFRGIGNSNANSFKGTFNGNGYVVKNLTIEVEEDYVGLFGYVSSSTIDSLGVENCTISGNHSVGGLIGGASNSSITNCYATGSVDGDTYVGGLVAFTSHSSITNSYATGSLTGSDHSVGGLVGYAFSNSIITNSYATGNVMSSGFYTGGLAGLADVNSIITNSYSTGNVTSSSSYVGGLAGLADVNSIITNSYATGNVTSSSSYVGGLVGKENGSITNCYSTGSVSGSEVVGGLVGKENGSITNCYSTGSVSGSDVVGGLVGENSGSTISSSYYNQDVFSGVGSGNSTGVEAKTVEEILAICTPEAMGFTQDNGWTIVNGTPLLSWQKEAQSGGGSGGDSQILLQVGTDSSWSSQVGVDLSFTLDGIDTLRGIGLDKTTDYFTIIDNMLSTVAEKQVEYGAAQNRLESALSEIETKYSNLVSSRSTLRDADIAEVSSQYIQQQILQQASATLLSTANQTPSIALQLI